MLGFAPDTFFIWARFRVFAPLSRGKPAGAIAYGLRKMFFEFLNFQSPFFPSVLFFFLFATIP